MRRLMIAATFGVLIAFLLATPLGTSAAGEQAGGTLVDGAGNQIGNVQLVQTANGVVVTVSVTNASILKAGNHGIHFHAVGKCDGPDFTSAGGHFNPMSKQHGLQNPNGAHAGDLPNFFVGSTTASGNGYTYTATTTMITLSPGVTSIFDADGTALVIHANPDDEMTDPTGNSGGRVACANLVHSASAAPLSGPARAFFFLRRLGDG
ncbi:MAG: superoxide dismutase family protein [Thermomicrobia bacterium]|nr:superoxide dismutase family protein [Thermomicrobia bacterium]